ncbi:hypothetical protein G8V07_12525 [Clostridium botulinum D/C]|uniref:hypothetical protein n=1 Tax=Clostridium botulinum TaxID=1491 RepID=UPI001E5D2D1D|nr:hypothetical protein [Clostridium botulinum]MCD3321134.1 hypothetical protein [Clostridium botulinum D/C]MCD3324574.1 hypothetical protein [Clostridium botulinum D/C]MCD3326860.1 hypothetical protein [Clostridium botulinum D/C]
MTCIVGMIDKENEVTYIGGDSCASNWMEKSNIQQKKVFKLKDTNNAIIGFSGSLRDLNILTYATGLIDKRDEPNIDEEYIVTKFIPQLRGIMKDNGRCYTSNSIEGMNSYLLLGYKDKLWIIHMDYSVCSHTDNFMAIGSGTCYALGSLEATKSMDTLSPIEKIHLALQSASKLGMGVQAPFYIMNTKDDEVIKFED